MTMYISSVVEYADASSLERCISLAYTFSGLLLGYHAYLILQLKLLISSSVTVGTAVSREPSMRRHTVLHPW